MSEKQLETRTLLGFSKYLFREDGAILSLVRPGVVLRPSWHKGRLAVSLQSDDGRRSWNLAALIWAAFHGPLAHFFSITFRDDNPRNCAASNLCDRPRTRRSRWTEGHVAQPLEVARLLSASCRECGGFFTDHDLVTGQKDRRCRFCKKGMLADVAEHESREAALALFGVPTQSTEVLLDIRHLHDELWRRIRSKRTDKEQYLLYARFWEDLTLKEAGEAVGLSVERMRQIESRALRKLRTPMWTKRKRYIHLYPFNSSFAEQSYQGPRSVGRKEDPEEPAPVRIVLTKEPDPKVDFEALAALLES